MVVPLIGNSVSARWFPVHRGLTVTSSLGLTNGEMPMSSYRAQNQSVEFDHKYY